MTDRAMMLRLYLGEADKHGHEALYKHLVKLLQERGIWGATAHRGTMGFGAKSVLHAASPLLERAAPAPRQKGRGAGTRRLQGRSSPYVSQMNWTVSLASSWTKPTVAPASRPASPLKT